MRRIVEALARVVCTAEIDELGLHRAVADHVALTLGSFPPHLRALVRVLFAVFDLAALPFCGRRFVRLDVAAQERWFARWWTSGSSTVRQLAKLLKGLVALAYWDQPCVRARLGYHPERHIAEVSARRLRVYHDDIAAAERRVTERRR
jgi:hypothetical protein